MFGNYLRPTGCWRNSTPFFGAAALCTIKIEPELLTTWSCSKPPSNQLSDQRNLTKFEQNDNKKVQTNAKKTNPLSAQEAAISATFETLFKLLASKANISLGMIHNSSHSG